MTDKGDVPVTIIGASPPRTVLLILGSVAFVAVGGWFLVQGDGPRERLTGLASLLFFGACGMILIGRVLRDQPELVISDDGLEHPLFGAVTWDEVAYVTNRRLVVRGVTHTFLEVVLHDPDAVTARQSAAVRAIVAANRTLGFGPFVISTTALAADADDLSGAMLEHHPDLIVAADGP